MAKVEIPDWLKPFCVPIQFSEAVPHYFPHQFKLIRLSREVLDMGEAEVFEPTNVFQSHRIEGLCLACRYKMRKVDEIVFQCENRSCVYFQKRTIVSPLRGVVAVLTFPESVRYREGNVEFLDWCLIVLDRRYGDTVHKAVRMLAGVICETARIKMI